MIIDPTKFKEMRSRAYRDVFLNFGGEQVLLIRDYGRASNAKDAQTLIDAAVASGSYIQASISESEEDPITNDGFTRQEQIIAQVCRDPSAKNSDGVLLGGLKDPNIHDAIRRDVSVDPLQIPYMYQHTYEDMTADLWRLTFIRTLQGTQVVST